MLIKQCCLQLLTDGRSFWKQSFCDKHLCFLLWKSPRSLRAEQSLAAFVSFTKILFLADLMLANLYTSIYNMKFQM